MAGEIVASNAHLLERTTTLRTLFDAGHSLRLFSNDIKPLPKDTLSTFSECGFPGYARKNMHAQWKLIVKVKDGEYQFSSRDQTFTPTGPSNELCYGWFLTDGVNVKMSCRLPFPVLMTLNQALTVRADVQVWALSIL